MGWKLVQVPAWEPDPAPPGVVTPPIYNPPGIWGPTDPRPTPPIAPGGPPPSVWPPAGVVTPPIYYPPEIWPTPPGGGGAPGTPGTPGTPEHPIYNPPGIWGPTDPRPTPPIAPGGPPPGVWPPAGVVTPPIYYPPGIWGPTDPRPTPPIAPGGPPPGIWPPPGVVTPPIYLPQPPTQPPVIWPSPPGGIAPPGGYPGFEAPPPLPTFDPDDIPEHPELPDLNVGVWMRCYDPTGRTMFWAFVTTGPESDNPTHPENGLPGTWVAVVMGTSPEWAWRPTAAETPPEPPDGGEAPPVVDNTLPTPEEPPHVEHHR